MGEYQKFTIVSGKNDKGASIFSVLVKRSYDIHFDKAREIVERAVTHPPIKFNCPKGAFDRAEKGDTELVTEIFEQFKSQYAPQESLGKMNIVL